MADIQISLGSIRGSMKDMIADSFPDSFHAVVPGGGTQAFL